MKYEPRKVFILENNEYIEISAKEHQYRKETDPRYKQKHFILVQGYESPQAESERNAET